jgi:pimeloyl-ACP methyl ester carboxylesterase
MIVQERLVGGKPLELGERNPKGKKGTILFVHGFMDASESELNQAFIDGMESNGYRVLTLGMRGHGEPRAGVEFEPEEVYQDIVDSVKAIRGQGDDKLFIVGHSLGGHAAVNACAKDEKTRAAVNGLFMVGTPNEPGSVLLAKVMGKIVGLQSREKEEAIPRLNSILAAAAKLGVFRTIAPKKFTDRMLKRIEASGGKRLWFLELSTAEHPRKLFEKLKKMGKVTDAVAELLGKRGGKPKLWYVHSTRTLGTPGDLMSNTRKTASELHRDSGVVIRTYPGEHSLTQKTGAVVARIINDEISNPREPT